MRASIPLRFAPPVALPLALLLQACAPTEGDDRAGLLGNGLLDPFPSSHLVVDGRLAIPEAPFPPTETPIPVETVAFRTGFSPVQTAVVRLPGVNPDALPSWRNPTPGEGGVLLVDLTEGRFYPVMAELDAWPDNPEPALLIRPQAAIPYGHTAAFVVTTAAAPRPERFEALLSRKPPEDFAHNRRHYLDLMDQLEELGVDPDEVALAWDFPVGDGRAPMRSALEQLGEPGTWEFDLVRNAEDGDDVPRGAWRIGRARYDSPSFLLDNARLDRVGDGTVRPTGTDRPELWAFVPESVKDAPAGSVPVMIIGHGIFSRARDMIDIDGTWATLRVPAEEGWIVIAADLRGLDWNDRAGAITVADDFGRLNEIPDRMLQGQINQHALIQLLTEGGLADDPMFQGASGQKLLDTSNITWWGMSMGSILGGVVLANNEHVDRAVFHIGGSSWSTLLERSSNWTIFEVAMVDRIADPTDRQVLYSASQLWWDPVDPIAWTPELRERSFVQQMNLEDESVQNIGTMMLARSLELPVLSPAEAPPGLLTVASPVSVGNRALAIFDPGRRDQIDHNRPGLANGAHASTFEWPGVVEQSRTFLKTGEIVHYCGANPCTSSNRGNAP